MQNLASAVRERTRSAVQTILLQENKLAELDKLHAEEKGIKDLTGLEKSNKFKSFRTSEESNH